MTSDQRILARQALGLDGSWRRTNRNRACAEAGSQVDAIWREMVDAGVAVHKRSEGGMNLYAMTRQGAEKALNPGELLDPADCP